MAQPVKVKVIFDYDATQPDELTIKIGDIITDVKKQPGGWWEGNLNGKHGVFPDNFVEEVSQPSEPPKGPKVSDLRSRLADQIKPGPPPLIKNAPKPKQMAVVLFEYKPEQPDELELMEGDQVEIVRMAEEGWWEGVVNGRSGMFPSNFVKLMDTPPPVPPTSSNSYAGPPGGHKPNDIGHRPPQLGGRPPAEKPKMLPPVGPANESANPPQLPKRNRGAKARVIYSYHAQNDDELSLVEGQVINVIDQKLEDPGWWKGELNGRSGVFPDNFVELIPEDEPQQLAPQQQQLSRGAAPRGPSVRMHKPQLPQPEPEQPAKLPPRPIAHAPTQEVHKPEFAGAGADMKAPPIIRKPEPESTKPIAMVNGDDKAMMALRTEMDKLKASMVTKESYELLQRELKATKDALDSYKKENNKKILDLMREIDDGRKEGIQNGIELNRIRALAEEKFMSK